MLKKEKMVKKNINSCLDSRHYILLFSTGSRGWFFEKESKGLIVHLYNCLNRHKRHGKNKPSTTEMVSWPALVVEVHPKG